ncbi:MAG: universal stress protein [Planctomycetota bacterium]|nr:MAG: universal stress protein [Planctomycetota bacterium]
MKILVPLDGSRLADGILAHARRMGRWAGVEMHLLTVLDAQRGSQADREEAFAEARRHLASCAELLASDGIETKTFVVEGDPAAQILHHLERDAYDLVAMTTHGRSGLSRWVRGSVAERVLRHAPVPLLLANPRGLVKPDDSVRFGKILVPLDGSKRSAAVLDRVLPFALDSESTLVLVHVDTPWHPGVHPVPEVARRHAQQRAEAALDDVRCEVEERGVKKTVVLGRYGEDEAREILAAVEEEEPDLVAMSTHGRSGLDRFRFGSVAEKVLRDVRAPLFLDPTSWRTRKEP